MVAEATGVSAIEATRLPGGLFVITEKLPYLHSVTLGFAYRVGARDDPAGREGMAHLIEHMIFKGTDELDAKTINIIAETHGAELNGWTDKEGTCFYVRCPADQTGVMVELMGRILSAPAFAEAELSKEKEVVGEEIRASEEDPETCALNLLLTAVFGDAPLGRPGIGTIDSISRINRADLAEFYQHHYGAEGGVVVGVGRVEHGELVKKLAALDGRRCGPAPRELSVPGKPAVRTRTRADISQVHFCLAVPAFAYNDPRRYRLSVLNTALGGGVSSRLFQRLREEEGLVYSIGSFVELYEDAGLLGIYLSAEHQKLPRCWAVLNEELNRLRKERFTTAEFERALVMNRSAVLLGMETPLNRMLRLSRGYLMLGRVQTVEETIAGLEGVKRDEVNELIDELFNGRGFYVSAVGPIGESEVKEIIFQKGGNNEA
ncbi:MAG: M16 family metallopeptidase [bacterium]